MARAVIIIFLVVVLAAAALFLSYDRIFAYALSKIYTLDISYRGAHSNLAGEIFYKDLSLVSKKTNLGLVSRRVSVKPRYSLKGVALKFCLNDVNFMKKGKDEPVNYDTLTALLASPFNSQWKYSEILGDIALIGNELKINGLTATGEELKLSLNGSILYLTGMINANIIIYFSPALTAKVPPELVNTLLADEKSGWRSLSVKLSGDMNKPSIQLTGRLFRLTIKSASGT